MKATKLITVMFGATLLALTYYSLLAPSSLLSFAMDSTSAISTVRASGVLLIVAYAYIASFRHHLLRRFMTLLSLALVYIGFAGLFTDQLFAMLHYNIMPFDSFFLIQAGVLSLLISLEKPVVPQLLPPLVYKASPEPTPSQSVAINAT